MLEKKKSILEVTGEYLVFGLSVCRHNFLILNALFPFI